MSQPHDPPLRGSRVVALALVGGLLGAGVIVFGRWDWNGHQRAIATSGPFLLWAALICAQAALWFAALPALRLLLQRLESEWQPRVLATVAAVGLFVLAGIVLGAFVPAHQHWPGYEYLWNRRWKITLMGAAGAGAGLLAVAGIFRIYEELKEVLKKAKLGLDEIERYLELQDALHVLLLAVGAVLGLAILTAGAERDVVLTFTDATCAKGKGQCEAHFPTEYLLVYGLYFTTLLALVYAPAHLALMAVGRKIRDDLVGFDELRRNQKLTEWQGKRDALERLLDLRVGTAADFRAGVAILTPLTTSLLSLLFAAGR